MNTDWNRFYYEGATALGLHGTQWRVE